MQRCEIKGWDAELDSNRSVVCNRLLQNKGNRPIIGVRYIAENTLSEWDGAEHIKLCFGAALSHGTNQCL